MSRKQFCNILNEINYRSEEEVAISECASSEDDDLENPRTESPLNITSFSSDDEAENIATKATNSSNCYQSGSAMRKPLPLSTVKRTSLNVTDNEAETECIPHKVLSMRNSRESEMPKTLKSHTNISPRQTVRSIFPTLQRISTSRHSLQALAQQTKKASTKVHDLEKSQIVAYSSEPDPLPLSPPQCSQIIEAPTQKSPQKSYSPSELDLFVALLERKTAATPAKLNRVSKRSKQRYAKDSYLNHVQCTLESARTSRKFLEHDKKFGLLIGQQLRVLRLDVSFGVYLVTSVLDRKEQHPIREEGDTIKGKLVHFVLDADMARRVKVGSRLEAFFNSGILPYMVTMEGGEAVDIYVQPNKLLLLPNNANH